jgi:hypothetical protein
LLTPNTFQRDLSIMFRPIARRCCSLTCRTSGITPKLTVDLGFRHDFYPPATPRLAGGFVNYDAATNNLVVAGVGNNPMNLGRKTYYTGFALRLGLAYRFDNKTVLRAGFGLSWIPFPDNKYAWDNFPVKQSNPITRSTRSGTDSTGSVRSDGDRIPAPQAAVIPSNGSFREPYLEHQ